MRPDTLPRETIIIDVDISGRICADCGSDVACRLLLRLTGTLMTDCYSACTVVAKDAHIRHAVCMAHVHRKFYDIPKADRFNTLAQEAMSLIGSLYEIEPRYAHVRTEDRLTARQKDGIRILEAFRTWLFRTGSEAHRKAC